MAKYRKKPVVVHAWQNDGEHTPPVPMLHNVSPGNDGALIVLTPEGVMRCDVGDWLICGVAGEVYPCKPDIFEKTYEPVED